MPSKLTPPIFLAVANAVAVAAFPLTSPVISPLTVNLLAKNVSPLTVNLLAKNVSPLTVNLLCIMVSPLTVNSVG